MEAACLVIVSVLSGEPHTIEADRASHTVTSSSRVASNVETITLVLSLDSTYYSQQNGRLENLVTLYSAQPYCCSGRENKISSCVLSSQLPAWTIGLKGLKGCCHLELKCSVLLCIV